ncbi:hypothetical protein [Pedobacter sp.]
MKKLDAFEWLLICLILAAFILGLFVATERHQETVANLIPEFPLVAICR